MAAVYVYASRPLSNIARYFINSFVRLYELITNLFGSDFRVVFVSTIECIMHISKFTRIVSRPCSGFRLLFQLSKGTCLFIFNVRIRMLRYILLLVTSRVSDIVFCNI